MLSRQLFSLGLAMSMHALLCFQLHLTLDGLSEMLIMFLLGFANSVLGFVGFYYIVRGLCLVSLEIVGECSRSLLTIQCFMYYGCFNGSCVIQSAKMKEHRRTVRSKKRPISIGRRPGHFFINVVFTCVDFSKFLLRMRWKCLHLTIFAL